MWLYIIFGIFIVATIVLVIYFKSKPETIIKENPFERGEILIKIKGPFMDKQETYYFDFMQRHLEQDKLIVPKIGIDNLLAPIGNKKQYEAISSKYVDFIIFDKVTMLPIVAIDLVEEKMSSKLTYFDKDVSSALKIVKIPIYTQYVEDFYVYDDIMAEMKKQIPALYTYPLQSLYSLPLLKK
ncbi:MAG: DUF2726 domain-containing protein, partial [Christensenellales bacterium]